MIDEQDFSEVTMDPTIDPSGILSCEASNMWYKEDNMVLYYNWVFDSETK